MGKEHLKIRIYDIFLPFYLFWYATEIIANSTIMKIEYLPIKSIHFFFGCLILSFMVIQALCFQKYTLGEGIVVLIISIVIIISTVTSKDTRLLFSWLFVFTSKNTEIDVVIKKTYKILVIMTMIVIGLNIIGFLPDYTIYKWDKIRYSLGFAHPNQLGLRIGQIVICHFYLNKDNLRLRDYILAILLAMAMVFSMAACGGSTDENAGSEEAALKVGFIYIGSVNDGGYTQAQHAGTLAMLDHFGGKVEAKWIENVSDADKSAAIDAATNLIDQGCNVIVGCSFGFMDALEELANSGNYDDVNFLHFSGNKMNDTNFGNYFGATEEPRYLTGIIAGMMTKTNKLGYVAAFPYTEVQIGIDAFTLGAQSVNPDVEVKVVYINSWYDPETERSAADGLLEQGCDIITQHCDTTGPQVAAAEVGAYAIGYNLDNSNVDAVKASFLTAPTWHHENFLIPTFEAMMNGTWTPESYYGYMADGYVDLAPMTDLVPADVQEKINEVRTQMEAKEFYPFSGEIKYNDGTVLCEEGQTLTREEVWSINGLVEGATGSDAK